MKLQIQGQSLRWRIDEAELALLLAGGQVVDHSTLPDGQRWQRTILLSAGADALLRTSGADWQLQLPSAEVAQLAQRLPCREGLSFLVGVDSGAQLALSFDVDVRDSRRQRTAPAVPAA